MLQKSAVRLFLFIDIYTFHKTVQEFFLLRIRELVVQPFKIQQKLIHIVAGNIC